MWEQSLETEIKKKLGSGRKGRKGKTLTFSCPLLQNLRRNRSDGDVWVFWVSLHSE